MHDYELTLIFIPDLTEEKINATIKKLALRVKSKDFWGRRVLAYPLKKHKEGIYLMMRVELKPEEVSELESKLKLEEKVMRHLLIKK